MRETREILTCDRCGAVDAPGTRSVSLPLMACPIDGVHRYAKFEADWCPDCMVWALDLHERYHYSAATLPIDIKRAGRIVPGETVEEHARRQEHAIAP